MAAQKKKAVFDHTDPICGECILEDGLADHIRLVGARAKCACCGKVRRVLPIEDIGAFMYPILKDHFVPGEDGFVAHMDDDNGHFEQEGESLTDILVETLGDEPPFLDELEDAIQAQDPTNPMDGDFPYFDDGVLFQPRRLLLNARYESWQGVLDELRHSRRFFSEKAKSFFKELFRDVDRLQGFEGRQLCPVVRALPVGSLLYRARSCDEPEIRKRVAARTSAELGPPPREHARAGRMNAAGVPVFYGALDPATCIAEVRPPLRGKIAVAEFETTRRLRLVDFRRLETARHGVPPISLFHPDYDERMEKQLFILRLHRLISAPVLPGNESEYLITQAMAEYLAHVRTPSFDGVSFSSAQKADGTNVVLFPTNFHDVAQPARRGLLRYQAGSLTFHEVRMIEYTAAKLSFFEDRDGEIQVYDPMATPDDDDDA
jgi:hypothetical protein